MSEDEAYVAYRDAEYAKFHEEALEAEYHRAYEAWAQEQRDSQEPDSEDAYQSYLEASWPEGT